LTTDLSQMSTGGAMEESTVEESTVWRTTTSTNDVTVIDNISTELPVSELPVTELPITESPAFDTSTPLTTDSVTVTVPTASSIPNITTSIQSSTAASTVRETTTQRSTTDIITTESPSPRAIFIRDLIHLHRLAWNVELSNTDSAEYLGNVNLLQNDLRIILQCPENCDFSNIQFSNGTSDMMWNRAAEGTIAKYGVNTATVLNDEQLVAMYNEKFESFANFDVLLLIADEDVQQKSPISLDNLGENSNDAEENSVMAIVVLVSIVVLIIAIIAISVCCCSKRRRKKSSDKTAIIEDEAFGSTLARGQFYQIENGLRIAVSAERLI